MAITVDDETFKLIEDFRFENRIQTRSEAIRQLILAGLREKKRTSELPDKKVLDEISAKILKQLDEGIYTTRQMIPDEALERIVKSFTAQIEEKFSHSFSESTHNQKTEQPSSTGTVKRVVKRSK